MKNSIDFSQNYLSELGELFAFFRDILLVGISKNWLHPRRYMWPLTSLLLNNFRIVFSEIDSHQNGKHHVEKFQYFVDMSRM